MKYLRVLAAGSVLALGSALSCSGSSEDDGGSGSGGSGASGSGGSSGFRDVDGDGELDPITPEEFGGGATPITEAEVEELRGGACSGWTAAPEPVASSLLMVIDVSNSMSFTTDATGNRTKWEITRDALTAAVGELPNSTSLGLLFYPNLEVETRGLDADPRPASACVRTDALVPSEPLTDAHRADVIDMIDSAELHTCTPTHDAYVTAREHYAAANIVGSKYILLITDGQPTLSLGCVGECSDNLGEGAQTAIVTEVTEAFAEDHIRTFVVGSPGSEATNTGQDARWWLSQAAEAGGTSRGGNCTHTGEPYCHYDMTVEDDFAAGLTAALATIIGQVVSCDYALPEPPAGETLDTGAVNLVAWPDGGDAVQILRAADGSCTEGWYFDDATQQARLCSDTCDLVQSDPRIRLELMFGCQSDVVQPT